MISLEKIIASVYRVGRFTKKVGAEYFKLIDAFENELNILLNLSSGELLKITSSEITEGVLGVREGKVEIEPEFDGQYGKIKIFENSKP